MASEVRDRQRRQAGARVGINPLLISLSGDGSPSGAWSAIIDETEARGKLALRPPPGATDMARLAARGRLGGLLYPCRKELSDANRAQISSPAAVVLQYPIEASSSPRERIAWRRSRSCETK